MKGTEERIKQLLQKENIDYEEKKLFRGDLFRILIEGKKRIEIISNIHPFFSKLELTFSMYQKEDEESILLIKKMLPLIIEEEMRHFVCVKVRDNTFFLNKDNERMYDLYTRYNEILEKHKLEWAQNIYFEADFEAGYDEKINSFYFVTSRTKKEVKKRYFFADEEELLFVLQKVRIEAKKYRFEAERKCMNIIQTACANKYHKKANVIYFNDFGISIYLENLNDVFNAESYKIALKYNGGESWVDYNDEERLIEALLGRFLMNTMEKRFYEYISSDGDLERELILDVRGCDMNSSNKQITIIVFHKGGEKEISIQGDNFLEIVQKAEEISTELAKQRRLSQLFQ